MPAEDKKLVLEVRRDTKTIVDWAEVWICDNVWLIGRFTHNKEADSRARNGVQGREGEWVDTANVVWSEVIGLCGFWDGSCEIGTCGAGFMNNVVTEPLDGLRFTKSEAECWVENSLDAELGGCGMLMETLSQWIDKSLHEQ